MASKKKQNIQFRQADVIQFELPKEEVLEYQAQDIPLNIIYEDEALAIINKPQGMVVHPSAGAPFRNNG
ncbi:ribosomal large subunit pseudouridine synthase D [Streptococcus dysgalactiae]|nr:ribosomal large subunit pseudouridine synthase D [Streptococcus dysgalactiae]